MLRLLLIPLSLSILSASSAAQTPTDAPLGVGDRLPLIVIDGLSQTEAGSYSDFYGRAVLLEFFAHWCGPCAGSIPHVNELQEKFGARGFSVVGVTSESAKKTSPWIEKHKAKYAYGYDTSGELHRLFQVKGIPFSVLVDPFGTVLWTGHPQRLKEQQIEAALENALEQPVWQWPEGARALAGTLEKGEYAAALKAASALPPQEGFDPVALVRGRVGKLVARFEQLVEGGEHSPALRLGARLEKELVGLPEGEQLAARLRELRSDPVLMRDVAALDRMTAFEARAAALRGPALAEKLRSEVEAFVKEQAGQKQESRAKALLDTLDKMLDKSKGKKNP